MEERVEDGRTSCCGIGRIVVDVVVVDVVVPVVADSGTDAAVAVGMDVNADVIPDPNDGFLSTIAAEADTDVRFGAVVVFSAAAVPPVLLTTDAATAEAEVLVVSTFFA